MTIKRISCLLLTLVMVLTLAACGSSSSAPVGNGDTNKSDIDINTLADAKRANFPEPSEAYDTVLSNVQMDQKTFDVYLSRMVAAYDNMNDEEFCKYIYELNPTYDEYTKNIFSLINSTCNLLALDPSAETSQICLTLSTFNTDLSEFMSLIATWNMVYNTVGTKIEDAPTYADLKDEMKPIINTFSNLLYGKDMVH